MYEEAGNSNLLMLLNTAVYPFLVAAAVTLLGKFSSRLSHIGLGVGFLVALSLIHSGLNFPPSKAMDFLVVSTLIGIAATFALQSKVSQKVKSATVFVGLLVSFYLLLDPVLQHQGSTTSILWSTAYAVVTTLIFTAQIQTADTRHSQASMAALAIIAAATAPVVSIGGSLLIGQLLGGLAASIAAYILVQKFLLKQSSSTGLLTGSFIVSGLLAQAHVLADLPLWAMTIAYLALISNIALNLIIKEDGSMVKTIKSLIPQVITSGAIAGISLWAIWPESSLY